jgi:hypothetical protein
MAACDVVSNICQDPSHPPRVERTFLELNGVLLRGEQHLPYCDARAGSINAESCVGVGAIRGGRRLGPAGQRSPRHRMPCNSRNEGSQRLSMTWRADMACHVIGSRSTQDEEVQRALDDVVGDVAGTIWRALPPPG